MLWIGAESDLLISGKTQLVLFNWSNNTGAIDVKWMGLFMRENHLLRC